MTRLDALAEWSIYFLQFGGALFALLQLAGVLPTTDTQAVSVLLGTNGLSVFIPAWIRKAQDTYDKIQVGK